MQIQIKKLTETAMAPTRATEKSAGYDLYADILSEVCIEPGETKKIGTGIAVAAPPGTFGAIFARSGLATKRGLRPANCVGVVDEDYRGECIVALYNDSNQWQIVQPGERIAQLVFIPYITSDIVEVGTMTETERGAGGFGSTGA